MNVPIVRFLDSRLSSARLSLTKFFFVHSVFLCALCGVLQRSIDNQFVTRPRRRLQCIWFRGFSFQLVP